MELKHIFYTILFINFFIQLQEAKGLNKIKSPITQSTTAAILPATIYYPIATTILAIPYALYKTIERFQIKKNIPNRNKLFQKINSKLQEYNETFDKTCTEIGEEIKEKIGSTNKNFPENFSLWTRAILTGTTLFFAARQTNKFLFSGKLKTLGQNYINLQNKYTAWRVLMVNKGWNKVGQFLNKFVIPTNATFTYTY